jgi:GST-like protein
MKLFRRAGWGSALVEYQLAWYGTPHVLEEVDDLFGSADARDAVRTFNPVAQIPTLLLDDGTVLTESAAITLWLAELTGRDDLVPGPGSPERPAFLRWLVFLVANIYPCFTFADDPARFVAVEDARKPFREAVNAHEERLWATVEAAASSPWFLGDRMSALDIYIAVMTRWRPGRAWFVREAPRLHAIAVATEALSALADVIAANHDPLLD